MKEAAKKQVFRSKEVDSAFKRKKIFLDSVRNGRIFPCICCHRLLYDNSVVELDDDWKEDQEQQFPGSISKFIGPIKKPQVYLPCSRLETPQLLSNDHVCFTCKKYLEKDAMAPMSNMNNLQLVDIQNHPELKLSELEQQLIALNLIFQKIVLLPKSRMNAMKDKTVSVPIATDDIKNTLTKLPRTPTDAKLSVVQLKRRLNFPGIHNQQLINMRNVVQALRTFIDMDNPHYNGILEDTQFKQTCLENDPEGYAVSYTHLTLPTIYSV